MRRRVGQRLRLRVRRARVRDLDGHRANHAPPGAVAQYSRIIAGQKLLAALAARLRGRRPAPDADPWAAFERDFWAYVEEPDRGELPRLRSLLHEALLLGETVDALLPEIRDDDGSRAELARRGGPVAGRLLAIRDELRAIRTPALLGLARDGEALVGFYGQHLYHALSLLATSWRDERLREQRERLGPVPWARRRLAALVEAADEMRGATA
jgi:hypothetical protein